jgi:hypothetical protein
MSQQMFARTSGAFPDATRMARIASAQAEGGAVAQAHRDCRRAATAAARGSATYSIK